MADQLGRQNISQPGTFDFVPSREKLGVENWRRG
jgi:hypothetical protein